MTTLLLLLACAPSTSNRYAGLDEDSGGVADLGFSSRPFRGDDGAPGAPVMLDDPSAWSVTGSTADERLGTTLLSGVDLNNDGWTDVVSGWSGADNAGTDAGRVEIFWGTSTWPGTTPGWAVDGSLAGATFGISLSAGDLDGDGIDDLAVGARTLSNGATSEGAVYVFAGASGGPSTTPTWSVEGGTANTLLGAAVDARGDFNNDGYKDLLVGAPGASSGRGQARVYPGSATGPATTPNSTVTGASITYATGVSVASIGDFNGDGYDDAAIGTNGQGGWLHLGTAAGLSAVAQTGYLGLSSTCFGCIVAGPGDLNGDGYAEIAFGAPLWDDEDRFYTASGIVWIYHGNASAAFSTGWTVGGDQSNARFAYPYGIGDVNGDGTDDLAVGSTAYDGPATDTGKVGIYIYNRQGFNTGLTPYLSYTTSQAGAGMGVAAGADDVDGDGIGDLLIGAGGYDDAEADGGQISLYTGTPDADLDGYLTSEDCDDGDNGVNPGATEVPANGIDEDCDGYDLCYVDTDDDLYGSTTTATSADLDCTGAHESRFSTDCDDADASRNPGATETVADGIDSDCNGLELCYRDQDRDGYGNVAATNSGDLDCVDVGESRYSTDCNDAASSVNPAATEVPGDGIDQNCDGSDGAVVCYVDNDLDGFGSTTTLLPADGDCTDPGESTAFTDCNDTDAGISPAAVEVIADGLDQDCDGHDTCWADTDHDGYGGTAALISAGATCVGVGESTTSSDCDDTRVAVHPGATEVPGDGIDQSCDGMESCPQDADGDHAGGTGTVTSADLDCLDSGEAVTANDCNDTTATIAPGAAETTADGIDQDCDGHDLCYVDTDGDRYGTAATVIAVGVVCGGAGEALDALDCDDLSVAIHPSAPETVADGIDQDCDGGDICYSDEDADGAGGATLSVSADLDCVDSGEARAFVDCDDGAPTIHPGATEAVADDIDQDCDGHDLCWRDGDEDGFGGTATVNAADATCAAPDEADNAEDCDDAAPSTWPGAPETVADGIDQDCDGGDTCYADEDGDGDAGDTRVYSADLDCRDAGEGEAARDCDDADPLIGPEAEEQPADAVDQDCDGIELCLLDTDADGFGDTETVASSDLACDDVNEAAVSGDCAPTDGDIHPGAEEVVADGIDQDCDGGDTCYADRDGDGYGGTTTTPSANRSCADAGESTSDADCDDDDAATWPGATEVPDDGIDQNCDDVDAVTVADTGGKDGDEGGGCGCASGPASFGAGWAVALATLLARRRVGRAA